MPGMAYTVEQCKAILEQLRVASEGLAAETMSSASINGVEYTRTDTDRLGRQIDRWKMNWRRRSGVPEITPGARCAG